MKTTINFIIKDKNDPTVTIHGSRGPMTTIQDAKDRICELRRSAYDGKYHNSESTYTIIKVTTIEEEVYVSDGVPVHTLN